MKALDIVEELLRLQNKEKAAHDQLFFKTGKGQYGEGDRFVGVTVPQSRKLAKNYYGLPMEELRILLKNPIHEARFIALILLTYRYKKEKGAQRKELVDFYLLHTAYMNNWDLVDVFAPHILGHYLYENPSERNVLYRLAQSESLWEQRISIIATLGLVRKGEIADALKLSELHLFHPHDLMHKAVGWTLREIGKRDRLALCNFLDVYAAEMPRTALRYAIEHFSEPERKAYLMRKNEGATSSRNNNLPHQRLASSLILFRKL